jgi:hypothetical protein
LKPAIVDIVTPHHPVNIFEYQHGLPVTAPLPLPNVGAAVSPNIVSKGVSAFTREITRNAGNSITGEE